MAQYFVRKTGSDANAGTSAGAAKLTIQAAVNLATSAGDVVYVGAGSYRETVTLGSSGSSGNPIQIIGDYSGAQTGDAGVVRITGSNDDYTATRANCVTATSKSYVTVCGFTMDTTTGNVVYLSSCVGVTIDKCHLSRPASGSVTLLIEGASQSAITVSRCYIVGGSGARAIGIDHSSTVSNAGHVVENCIVVGAQTTANAVGTNRVGGWTIRNCLVGMSRSGVAVATALAGGQTVTVNNCLFWNLATALQASTAGEITENYNCIGPDVTTARTNVSAGANSVTRAVLFDTRWWHSLVAGGSIVSPYDLPSYSTLVEYNSGTGAPSTDARGASVKGTYREWGPLEYDSALGVSGGSALGLPIIGSAIFRGET